MSLNIYTSIIIFIAAFTCEYMDSSIGMGYGTTLTPVLLFLGFEPIQIVPAILLSEFITGASAGILHVLYKNIRIGHEIVQENKQVTMNVNFQELKSVPSLKLKQKKYNFIKKFSLLNDNTKVIIILSSVGALSSILAAIISTLISTLPNSKFIIKTYVNIMVITMGIIILAIQGKKLKFSMKRITTIGVIAGFNKAISAGGYGPIITSGQIMAGMNGKNAVASTTISESITCLAGIITYFCLNLTLGLSQESFAIAPILIAGAVLSSPLAVLTTKKFNEKKLKITIGVATLILGISSLFTSLI
ncbi:MAG: sulfite exporter TauE/SafE family protein [Promethearchaeota archaeon]